MLLTGRANHDLTLSSFRAQLVRRQARRSRPLVPRPVTDHPAHGDNRREAEEGGGDLWLKWEMNDLPTSKSQEGHSRDGRAARR